MTRIAAGFAFCLIFLTIVGTIVALLAAFAGVIAIGFAILGLVKLGKLGWQRYLVKKAERAAAREAEAAALQELLIRAEVENELYQSGEIQGLFGQHIPVDYLKVVEA